MPTAPFPGIFNATPSAPPVPPTPSGSTSLPCNAFRVPSTLLPPHPLLWLLDATSITRGPHRHLDISSPSGLLPPLGFTIITQRPIAASWIYCVVSSAAARTYRAVRLVPLWTPCVVTPCVCGCDRASLTAMCLTAGCLTVLWSVSCTAVAPGPYQRLSHSPVTFTCSLCVLFRKL